MMIQTVRLTRKKAVLAVILAGVLLTALILLPGRGGAPEEPSRPQLTGNAERVAYLKELGWEVAEEPVTTLQFLLPSLQRIAEAAGLRSGSLLRQAGHPVHLRRLQLSRTA